jgi:hypothetical protein
MSNVLRVAAVTVSLVMLLSQAASSSATSPGVGPMTTCGPAYVFKVGGRTIAVGGCAGILPRTAQVVTVHVGSRFSAVIEHEQSGGLDFPVPSPNAPAVALLHRSGADVSYVARAKGTSVLLARRTHFCAATDPALGTCPALKVHVIAG